MFYPQLEKLKTQYDISEAVIDKLDTWLALLTKFERVGFTSDFFAREYGLDYEFVNTLFIHLVEIGLLSINYDVYCPRCNEFVERFEDVSKLPETLLCDNGDVIQVTDKVIALSYTLKQKPQKDIEKKKDDSSIIQHASTMSLQEMKENVHFRHVILDKQFYFPNSAQLMLLADKVEQSFNYKGKDAATVKGKALENFATELFNNCIAFKCSHDVRTSSNQIDVKVNTVPTVISHPFITRIGSVFLVECKNKNEKITSRIISEVDSILNDYQCNFGVVIGRNILTGEGRFRDANSRRFKIYYDKKRVIVVLTFAEIRNQIIDGEKSLITLLEEKYDEFIDQF